MHSLDDGRAAGAPEGAPEGRALALALGRWVGFCARRPWVVLALWVAAGAGCLVVALGLGFRGDFAELLPESTDEVRDMHFVEERAGGVGYLVVQVTGGDAPARRAFADHLAPALEAQPELVRYVEHRTDAEFFRARALLLMPLEKLRGLRDDLSARLEYERQRANPLFVDLVEREPPPTFPELEARYAPAASEVRERLESKDGAEAYLFIKPTGSPTDLDFDRRLLAALERTVSAQRPSASGLTVRLTGLYAMRVEEDDAMKADLARASLLSAALALGLILAATRRPTALAVVFLPVAVGIAFTFAVARLTVGHLNPITGFLAAVLVGLGIEYGVHLAMRFREERGALEVVPALRAAVVGTFNGAVTSALTNAAAFGVLAFAQFAAFRQFGLLAAVGVLATVVSTYVLGPALLVLAERLPDVRWGGARSAGAAGAGSSPVSRPRRRGGFPAWAGVALVASVAAFAGWSVSVWSRVGFDTNLRAMRGASPATDLNVHVSEQLGVIMNPALIHVETLEQAREVVRLTEAVRAEGGVGASIDRVLSLGSLLPSEVEAKLAVRDELEALLDGLPESMKSDEGAPRLGEVRALLEVAPWGPDEVPEQTRRRFAAEGGGGWLVLVFPRDQSFDTREADAWADALTAIVGRARAGGVPARVLDANRIASRILRLVRADGPTIMLGAALAVFAMIWVSLRRLSHAALVAAPLYLGMASLVGVMHLLGLKLNFFNIVLLPNLLAIAVDNSVHLFHRYREEGKGSLGHVVRTTGLAAVVATLSNAAGYGALAFADHAGLRSIAWLAMAGVGCTFVGTTLLFPALLALLERCEVRRLVLAPEGPSSGSSPTTPSR